MTSYIDDVDMILNWKTWESRFFNFTHFFKKSLVFSVQVLLSVLLKIWPFSFLKSSRRCWSIWKSRYNFPWFDTFKFQRFSSHENIVSCHFFCHQTFVALTSLNDTFLMTFVLLLAIFRCKMSVSTEFLLAVMHFINLYFIEVKKG